MKSIFLSGLILGAATAVTPAWAQQPPIPAAASAQTLPLIPADAPQTVPLKAMGAGWYRLKIETTTGAKAGSSFMDLMMMGGMSGAGQAGSMMTLNTLLGGGADSTYYTQGKTFSIASETFLIAYRLKSAMPSFLELIADSERNGGKEPDFTRLLQQSRATGDTPAQLVLINIRSVATLGDLRPFALELELADANRVADFAMTMAKKDEASKGEVIAPSSDPPTTKPAPTKPTPKPTPVKPKKP